MKYAVWILIFLFAFGVQLTLERLNVADSIGLWYTTYCAAIDTAIIGFAYVVVRVLIAMTRKSSSTVPDE